MFSLIARDDVFWKTNDAVKAFMFRESISKTGEINCRRSSSIMFLEFTWNELDRTKARTQRQKNEERRRPMKSSFLVVNFHPFHDQSINLPLWCCFFDLIGIFLRFKWKSNRERFSLLWFHGLCFCPVDWILNSRRRKKCVIEISSVRSIRVDLIKFGSFWQAKRSHDFPTVVMRQRKI